MKEVKAPKSYEINKELVVFTAGSIEMGKAENWQTRLKKMLRGKEVLLLNPRRDDWDSSWVQSIDDPKFNEQVTWELEGLEKADLVIFYFDPNTQSPITLLELGLCANSNTRCVVCCPEGFWRKGNVDIVCERYKIEQLDTLEELAAYIKEIA